MRKHLGTDLIYIMWLVKTVAEIIPKVLDSIYKLSFAILTYSFLTILLTVIN